MLIQKYDTCTLEKLYPGLYFLRFTDHYDMCMTFLRYQEKYESPNPKFRGTHFTIVDFMEWYAKDHKGVFTYTTDWGGFNVPSTIFEGNWFYYIPDKNKYDYLMLSVYYDIWHDIKYGDNSFLTTGKAIKANPKFYLVGAVDERCLNHEIAHGLYFLNPSYKKKMNALIKALPYGVEAKMHNWLLSMGYTWQVIKDEIQAYFSTGAPENLRIAKKYLKPFEEVYKNARNS